MANEMSPAQAQAVEDLKAKCLEWLADIAGNYQVDNVTDAYVRLGSARVNVRFVPFGEEQTLVVIFSYVLWEVPKTPELVEHVAFHSSDTYFGSLQLLQDPDDGEKVTVRLDHSLLGDYIDYAEFKEGVLSIASIADDLDTDLQRRFGGSTQYEDGS